MADRSYRGLFERPIGVCGPYLCLVVSAHCFEVCAGCAETIEDLKIGRVMPAMISEDECGLLELQRMSRCADGPINRYLRL